MDTREQTKTGRIVTLFPLEDCGFIRIEDEVEIYFHRNDVRGGAFDRLKLGTPVKLVHNGNGNGFAKGAVIAIQDGVTT